MARGVSLPVVLLAILLALAPRVKADSAAVLMYHRFGEDRYPSTNVREDAFREQLRLLAEGPWTVIDLRRLRAHLDDGAPLPERSVVITIDDAYRSVHDVAWPLLAEAGFPFTVFVATDPVDQGHGGIMDWDQMRAMAAQGVTFANHGASHDHLADRGEGESARDHAARVRRDLEAGQRRLDAELGPTGQVLSGVFAWPFGEYDSTTAAVLVELGWIAFGQQSGAVGAATDRRALPRFPINEAYSDLAEFRTKIDSLPLPVRAVRPWDPVTGPHATLEVQLEAGSDTLPGLACFVSGQGRVAPEWTGEAQFRVAPPQPLATGRQRVNCTAPGPGGRYYWFSHPWLVR